MSATPDSSAQLRAAFHARVLDPYGEGVMSLRDLVIQCRTTHPMISASEVFHWMREEAGHIDRLVSEGHLPADYDFAAMLDLVKEALTGPARAAEYGQEGAR